MEYKEYLKRAEWFAFSSAMMVGIFSHLLGLLNTFINNDDIRHQPEGYGAGVTSGRWAITILQKMFPINYNLPWVKGCTLILFIAISAAILVSIFQLKSRKSATLIGALFVVFPVVTSTMFFRLACGYYGLAVFLAVFAAWALERGLDACESPKVQNAREKKRQIILYVLVLILPVLCIAGSMGFYQAYVPLTISIFVLRMIQKALQGESGVRELICRGLYYCVAILLGVLVYFLMLQYCLDRWDAVLSSYMGIDEMGQLSIAEVPALVIRAMKEFWLLPFKDYEMLAPTKLVKAMYLLTWIVNAIVIAYVLLAKVKKPGVTIITILLCAVFPLAVNFIVIMCPNKSIHTLMVFAFALVPCVPFVLMETLPPLRKMWLKKGEKFLSAATTTAVIVIIFSYAYFANVNYTAAYFLSRQVENYMSDLVVQVRMTEGFDTEKQWAFIGTNEDPLLNNKWTVAYRYEGISKMIRYQPHIGMVLESYIGYSVPQASEETIEMLIDHEEVKSMPCWPNQGSTKVVGDTVVIKFQELSN